MTKDADNLQLNLLVPWELPIEQPLSGANQARVGQALNQLLQALSQTSSETALAIIDSLLTKLDTVEIFPTQISSTKTAVKSWEVEDFDRYFGVNHVQSPEPALCIVKSLVLAYRMFVVLSSQNNYFDSAQVERQKQGIISYVRLLSRVFDISLEETEW
jgi:hypothetical protein